jgi:OFA family oxalate/formate antiporter-like MFS transporter
MAISHMVPYLFSRGIDSRSVASIVLILGAAASIVGRILSGWLSDAHGRLPVLRLIVAMSAVSMPVLYGAGRNITVIYGAVALVYFCYGAQFCINAATCADFWGTKHVGLNYGIVITAWGVGGIIGPRIAGIIFDRNHNYRMAFLTASALGIIALICEFLARRPVPSKSEAVDRLIATVS